MSIKSVSFLLLSSKCSINVVIAELCNCLIIRFGSCWILRKITPFWHSVFNSPKIVTTLGNLMHFQWLISILLNDSYDKNCYNYSA